MHIVLLACNSIALAVVMIAAMAMYFVRPRPHCLRQHVMQVALMLISVGAFGALLAPTYLNVAPDWWSVVMRVGVAIVAFRMTAVAMRRKHDHDMTNFADRAD